MRIFCYNPNGYAAGLVQIEVSIRRGLPAMDIVGLAGAAVREARERVRAALASTGHEFPFGHIVVSLSPADMPKSGAAFDLGIALALLDAASNGTTGQGTAVLVMGELTLGGNVNPVEALIPALLEARQSGIQNCIVPSGNRPEALALNNDCVFLADSLDKALVHFHNIRSTQSADSNSGSDLLSRCAPSGPQGVVCPVEDFDISALQDNPLLAFGLLSAAAGRHHILLYGPPGGGKTMALRFLGNLLPGLSEGQLMEVNRLHSLAGRIDGRTGLVSGPPICMPHHSSSSESLLGGGRKGKPGEISLAHQGLLILDEAAEFRKNVLQALREPMEEGVIRLGRVDGMVAFPASFILGMSLNPCPCGRYGSKRGSCSCSVLDVQNYWARIGAPIIDRTDIRVALGMDQTSKIEPDDTDFLREHLKSVSAMSRIVAAVSASQLRPNGSLRGREVEVACSLDSNAQKILDDAVATDSLLARSRHGLLRLARTISSLLGDDQIHPRAIRIAWALRAPISPVEGIQLYR